MDNGQLNKELRERYPEAIQEIEVHNPLRLTATIQSHALLEVAEYVFLKIGFRFIIATAIHSKKGFEILYHFSDDSSGIILNIHVILPHQKPAIQSLTALLSGVEWIEREMHELFGIGFEGHPNLVPLISAGNWEEGTYPYRKDFTT
jgi:NADH-quinone oxidoreductase subunit C